MVHSPALPVAPSWEIVDAVKRKGDRFKLIRPGAWRCLKVRELRALADTMQDLHDGHRYAGAGNWIGANVQGSYRISIPRTTGAGDRFYMILTPENLGRLLAEALDRLDEHEQRMLSHEARAR